jgi:ribosomal 50S subunit-associated protein YjgA (DUF615 family)
MAEMVTVTRPTLAKITLTTEEPMTGRIEEADRYSERLARERRTALAQLRPPILETVPDALENQGGAEHGSG